MGSDDSPPRSDRQSRDGPPPSANSVGATYDYIAEHFAATRAYPWPEAKSFLAEEAPDDADRALDLGCGNGRHAEPLANIAREVVGLDASRGLLAQARERARTHGYGVSLVHGDAAALPFRASTFDLAVYVAALHHLTPRRSRVESLSELARVLRPDGVGFVSAWSTEHDRFDADAGFDTTVDWTLPGGETVPRFYHIYHPDEFRADLDASDLRVRRSFVSSGNCYAVVTGARTETR